MRPLAVLIPILLLAAVVPTLPDARAQGTASLEGIVCPEGAVYAMYPEKEERCSLQGLADATVRLQRAGVVGPVGGVDRSDATDADGRFSFAALEDGAYNVSVARTGFEPLALQVTVQGATWQDLRVEPKRVPVAGRVADDAGRGVAAELFLYGNYADAGDTAVEVAADGSFATERLAGHYQAEARAPGFYPTYQTVFLDGTQDVAIAMERVPPQTASVAGTVRDQDERPVPGARVSVYQCCGAPQPYEGQASGDDVAYSRPYYGGENHTTTDDQGRFRIHVDAGDVSLTVFKDGHAQVNDHFTVAPDESVRRDVTLMKYPEKTARLQGEVRDAATGARLRLVGLSVESPQFGIHECSSPAADRDTATAGPTADGGGSGAGSPAPAGMPAESSIAYPEPYPYPGCAIAVDGDGRFDGLVTPGYAIVRVHFQHWMTCEETRHADGSFQQKCGPEYYEWVQAMVLPADDTTRLVVALRQRPGPDATVSGYVLSDGADGPSGLPGARIEFSNLDTWAYGYAVTDEDGSYALRLRSGPHRVTVWADGHLHWEGVVDVERGDDRPFDVRLTPGEEAYGGCCWAYPMERGVAASDGAMPSATPAPMPPGAAGSPGADDGAAAGGEDADESSQAVLYEDLGGGLGPYDPAARERALADGEAEAEEDTPGAGPVLLLLALLAGVFLARRRLA